MKSSYIETPIGSMLAIADEQALYLLEFAEWPNLERTIERLKTKTKKLISSGNNGPIKSIKAELKAYFLGKLKIFTTPLHLYGSSFQQTVWQELIKIPYGETRSYLDQARAIAKPSAYRAVANANGANPIAIVAPCHRIINNNGLLGGYSGGLNRKNGYLNMRKIITHDGEKFENSAMCLDYIGIACSSSLYRHPK